MNIKLQKIIKLRKIIPSFKCKPGCHDCCGPIVFTKVEWEQINDKRKTTSIDCPYISEKGCACYKNRPILCRLFGTVKKLKCPHGYRPSKLLSERKEMKIMFEYQKLMKKDGEIVLSFKKMENIN